jgi:predicted component of type VI protein secretion system
MTKTWARPYLHVLKGKLSSWEDTHSPAGEAKVAESVVKAIEQLRVDEEIAEDLPNNLEQASTVIANYGVYY